jgi:DNA adenine methylase
MLKLSNDRVRALLSWCGGKSLHLDFLYACYPPHRVYVEVFGGAGSPLLGKTPAQVEVYNDINPGLTNLNTVVKDPVLSQRLRELLALTLNAREEHGGCKQNYPSSDPVEWARQFVVLTRQSRSAIFGSDWGYSIQSKGNSFGTAVNLILPVSARLRNVWIENRSFADLFPRYDSPDTLWYLDPPYLPSTRVTEEIYEHEMSHKQHELLLSLITKLSGMVVLSGYPSDLYDNTLVGWNRKYKQTKCFCSGTPHNGGGKGKPERTEQLWINPAATERLRRSRAVSGLAQAALLPK